MKSLLSGVAAAALALVVAVPALAADPNPPMAPAPAPPPPPPAFSWTGVYAGVTVGLGGGAFDYPFLLVGPPDLIGDVGVTSSGFVAGGLFGVNIQHNRMVFGVETDILWSGVLGGVGVAASGGGGSVTGFAGSTIDWYGTTRARLGFLATERFMIYGTGGVAYGRTTSGFDITVTGLGNVNGAISATTVGWAAGGGTEYAITENVSLKTEYLFVNLGASNLIDVPGTFALDVISAVHTVSTGIDFHF